MWRLRIAQTTAHVYNLEPLGPEESVEDERVSPGVGDPQEGSGVLIKPPLVLEPLLQSLIDEDGIISELEILTALLHSHLVRVSHPGLRRNPAV